MAAVVLGLAAVVLSRLDGALSALGALLVLVCIVFYLGQGRIGEGALFVVLSTLFIGVTIGPIDSRVGVVGAVGIGAVASQLGRGRSRSTVAPARVELAGVALVLLLVTDFVVRPAFDSVGSFLGVEFIGTCLVLVLMGWCRVRRSAADQWLALGGCATVAGLAAFDFYTQIQGSYERYELGKFNVQGIESSNYVSIMCVSVAVAFLAAWLDARSKWRVVSLLLFGLYLVPAVIFLTRSAVLVVVVGTAVLMVKRRASAGALVAILVVGTAAVVMLPMTSRLLDRLGSLATDSGSGRIDVYSSAVGLLDADPAFGIGGARFGVSLAQRTGLQYAHDLPLELIGRYGILLGVALLLWLTRASWVSMAGSAGVVGFSLLVGSIVEPAVETPAWGLVFAAATAAGIAARARPIRALS